MTRVASNRLYGAVELLILRPLDRHGPLHGLDIARAIAGEYGQADLIAGNNVFAHVPALTKALRVGPQSAGADPGPAGYAKGGTEPTVTDASIVLGYLPESAMLGGDMRIDRDRAVAAVQSVANALDFTVERAAAGIHDIVNETMIGALRLVSVQQGFDPRDFALMAFGGAGPMHANALARILGCWPVIVPPGPGVLCAYGDATTRARNEASRSLMRRFSETDWADVRAILDDLAEHAAEALDVDGIPRGEQRVSCEVDVRYAGQVLHLPVPVEFDACDEAGLEPIAQAFDRLHERLYTFALDADREIINLRAIVQAEETSLTAGQIPSGTRDPANATLGAQRIYVDGAHHDATVYDRAKLVAGNVIEGPAIVMQLDSTALVLPDHDGEIDAIGNILISPRRES